MNLLETLIPFFRKNIGYSQCNSYYRGSDMVWMKLEFKAQWGCLSGWWEHWKLWHHRIARTGWAQSFCVPSPTQASPLSLGFQFHPHPCLILASIVLHGYNRCFSKKWNNVSKIHEIWKIFTKIYGIKNRRVIYGPKELAPSFPHYWWLADWSKPARVNQLIINNVGTSDANSLGPIMTPRFFYVVYFGKYFRNSHEFIWNTNSIFSKNIGL